MRGFRSLLASVAALESQGRSLQQALHAILLDPSQGQFAQGAAGRLLALGGDRTAVFALLTRFHTQVDEYDLYRTALALEDLNDPRAIPPLIRALLHDENPHRRHAAARALGWIRPSTKAAARALARCLADPTQPQPAREEAAESLAYVGYRQTIDALISALSDPDVRIRFWATFGLGCSCRGDARAIHALESVLNDQEIPPGNWWSVGKEALAMLGMTPSMPHEYIDKLDAEIDAVRSNPAATPEDLRWADSYGPSI